MIYDHFVEEGGGAELAAALTQRHPFPAVNIELIVNQEDALAFASYLQQSLKQDTALAARFPAWLGDLLAYEAACIEANQPSCRLLVRWFRYPVRDIARALFKEQPPPETTRMTLAVWLRPTSSHKLTHRLF